MDIDKKSRQTLHAASCFDSCQKKYKQKQMTPLQPTVLDLPINPAPHYQPTLYFFISASFFSIDFPPSMQTSIKAAAMTCVKGKKCGRNTPSMCENSAQLTKHAREGKT